MALTRGSLHLDAHLFAEAINSLTNELWRGLPTSFLTFYRQVDGHLRANLKNVVDQVPFVDDATHRASNFEFFHEPFLDLLPKLVGVLPAAFYTKKAFLRCGKTILLLKESTRSVWCELEVLLNVESFFRRGCRRRFPKLQRFPLLCRRYGAARDE